jgi:hypothetical protein
MMMSLRLVAGPALALWLIASGGAAAQQEPLLTLERADDEDLILYPWAMNVDDIEDMSVQGADGAAFGDVEDVLVDQTGAVRAIVVDYGRTLGPADRQAIVPIERLTPRDRNVLVLDMTAGELQALPDWDD